MTTLLILIIASGAGSYSLTRGVLAYALKRSLLDQPNDRSSHSLPTPRGGGLAIATVVLVGILGLAVARVIESRIAVALIGGGALIALIGWIDDHKSQPAWLRLCVHVVASVWAVAWLGGFPRITVSDGTLQLGILGSILAVIGLVWLTNLYNFMDGIDGLAGGQAVLTATVAAILFLTVNERGLAAVALLIAAAAAGFVVLNWPPASIFMGDVASGFLGFLFGSLVLQSENADAVPAIALLLTLGTFIFDATVTLLRRMLRGEEWMRAHRSHAYQRLVQAGWSHTRATSALLGVGTILCAFAILGSARRGWLGLLLVLAMAILAGLYILIEQMRPMSRNNSEALAD